MLHLQALDGGVDLTEANICDGILLHNDTPYIEIFLGTT
jgi:hypothetical protein